MIKPIRILHVIGVMNRGGAETMIMNLYRNIDRSKVQFDFVENEGDKAAYDDEILSLGGNIYHCPQYRGKNHFAYIKWWDDFLKENKGKYTIIHGHIGSTASIYLSIAKKYGLYTIAHSHSADDGSLLYKLFSYPTRYIADSFLACSKNAAISRYGEKVGNDEKICCVLNNAIDTSKFVFNEESRYCIRTQLGIKEENLVIGHVGRFVGAKNHTFLLDVFEQIYNINSNAILLLVGDGELRDKIESLVEQKNLTKSVIFTGVKANVWDFYQAMDAFVFPSIYEGLPVSMIEAQTSGLKCYVSSNVSPETAITNLVKFISLNTKVDSWANQILEESNKSSRNSMVNEIKNAGYDIYTTVDWLTDFYLKVGKTFEE